MTKKANGGNSVKAVAKPKAAAKGKSDAESAKTLTPKQVKSVVREINKLALETVERGMLAIGFLVLEKVFKGILEAVFSRNPNKSKSLQQVCNDTDLRVDRRRLGEWVRAAALSKELTAKQVDCSNLSYSHFAALLQVEDEKERDTLARKANKGRWSARKLADEIGKTNPAKASQGKSKDLVKLLGNPEALMKDKEAQKILESPEDLEKLPFDVRLFIAKRADELVKSMADSTSLLKLAKRNIARIELGFQQAVDGPAEDAEIIDVQATVV